MRVDELVGEIAQDGGAARGDAALGNKGKEPREKLFHVDGGIQSGEFGEKFGGQVFRIIERLVRGTLVA